MSQPSGSRPDKRGAAWLEEQVYEPRRQRTIALVKQSIACLREAGQRVSLAAIVAQSKAIDPRGDGISESAILTNQDAYLEYTQHRTWKGTRSGTQRTVRDVACPPLAALRIEADRDLVQVRRRYMRLEKQQLVERLITAEQAYAAARQEWLAVNYDLLHWRLRAEQTEAEVRKLLAQTTGPERERRA